MILGSRSVAPLPAHKVATGEYACKHKLKNARVKENLGAHVHDRDDFELTQERVFSPRGRQVLLNTSRGSQVWVLFSQSGSTWGSRCKAVLSGPPTWDTVEHERHAGVWTRLPCLRCKECADALTWKTRLSVVRRPPPPELLPARPHCAAVWSPTHSPQSSRKERGASAPLNPKFPPRYDGTKGECAALSFSSSPQGNSTRFVEDVDTIFVDSP